MAEAQPQATEQTAPAGNPNADLNKFLESVNLADSMESEKLVKIGMDAHDGYMQDLRSKERWDKCVDEWVKLASQVKEEKTYPWPKASNVKYPLLATAAMQFAARAYPALVPADGKIVQFKVVGADPQGMKATRADKLAKHMNYQLMEDMGDWEEEMDRLLIQLPIVGCLFKKTYFDPIRKTNVSKLVGAKDLVVNYWATSLETTHRKTEIIPMTKNQIQTYKNAKVFLDVPLSDPMPEVREAQSVHGTQPPAIKDDSTPYIILEQHTFLDLDNDGYQEPYIITFEESSKTVLRIVARFDSDGIRTNEDGDIIVVEPVEYYTKYGFIPNPDGGFYDIGFGHLLGPINDSANTVINQLVDAGTLANLQAGFIGKGLRLKMGESRFEPGEWKAVNASGNDLKSQIFPLPTKEPSKVLFELLGLLLQSGKELASVSEIFTGKMPGQNTPATTTQATIEQGMKVFTAIYKRTYRALTKEFKKLFRLNSLYDENFDKAKRILDEQIGREDYDPESYDVCPTADPSAVSSTQKQQKVQMLGQLIPLGTINIMEATKRMLEAQEQPNMEALMQEPQPKPDPKMMAVEAKVKGDQAKAQLDTQREAVKAKNEQEKHQLEMAKMQFEAQMEQKMREFNQQMDTRDRMIEGRLAEMQALQKSQQTEREHTLKMATQHQAHQQKMTQNEEMANAKRQQRKLDGVAGSPRNSSGKRGNSGAN